MKKKNSLALIMLLLLLAFAVLMAGCSSEEPENDTDNPGQFSGNNDAQNQEDLDYELFTPESLPDVVAIINGQEISKEQFLADYNQMQILYEKAGMDIKLPDVQRLIQEALVSDMVTTVLLDQEAEKQGIVVNDEAVDKEVERVISEYENEDDFNDMLSELNITLDDFRDKMRRQLRVSRVMFAHVAEAMESESLDFTEEEKQQMYRTIESQLGDMPEYEEMKEDLDEMLEYTKVQVILGEYIKNLIDSSDVEIFIYDDKEDDKAD